MTDNTPTLRIAAVIKCPALVAGIEPVRKIHSKSRPDLSVTEYVYRKMSAFNVKPVLFFEVELREKTK